MGGRERITAKSSIGGRGRTGRDATFSHRVLTAIDLFAGAGGFSLGLRRAGFDVVLANEYSVDAEWTYRHNILGDTPEGVFPERPNDPSTRARKAYRAEARQQMLKDREALPSGLRAPHAWWRHPQGATRPVAADVVRAPPRRRRLACSGSAVPGVLVRRQGGSRRRAELTRPRSYTSYRCRPTAHCQS